MSKQKKKLFVCEMKFLKKFVSPEKTAEDEQGQFDK